MPDSTDNRSLPSISAARARRDQWVAQRLAQGEQRLGYRLADGVAGILTDAMQFAADLVIPGDRLVAARARPALAIRVARTIEPDTPVADLPAALGAVALAIDIAESGTTGAARGADCNGGAGCFVVGPWRAITERFADRELILERSDDDGASTAAIFADPVEMALALLRRCQIDGDSVPEGSVLLIVAAAPALEVEGGAGLVLAAGEIGTVSAEISL